MQLFEKFHQSQVRDFWGAVQDLQGSGEVVFRDQRFPYQVTVKRAPGGYQLVVEDTRKRWWGRKLETKFTSEVPVPGSSTQGPAYQALCMLESWIESDEAEEANKVDRTT